MSLIISDVSQDKFFGTIKKFKMKDQKDEFIFSMRVYYEDTDAAGVVYYANYLKFMERARSEWWYFNNDSLKEIQENSVFVVRSASLEFLQPAELGDNLQVSVKLKERRSASLIIHQNVVKSKEILCQGIIRLAYVDMKSFKPQPLPEFLNPKGDL